jgi:hypothetical protein
MGRNLKAGHTYTYDGSYKEELVYVGPLSRCEPQASWKLPIVYESLPSTGAVGQMV